MMHIALSNDDSVKFRYNFLYWHMTRETFRLSGPDAHLALEYSMDSEYMMANLKYAKCNGRINGLFAVEGPDRKGLPASH
jgi:hypothetical protein